jgi:crossover junction endodeoxyribonuclease RuvC
MTRILGIDPGSNITGYGVIDISGNHASHIIHGNIFLGDDKLPVKLRTVFEKITTVIKEYKPHEVAIEKVFMYRNADSVLKLGQARGAIITACTLQDLKVFEYSPNQIKQSTVGRGHAAKQQVQHMVKVLLCLNVVPERDAADALAVALCHAHSREGLHRMGMVSSIHRKRSK